MHDSDTSADGSAQADSAKIPASDSDPFLAFAIELGFDRRKKLKKNERHITVALAVLAQMRAHGEELISAPGGGMALFRRRLAAARQEMARRAGRDRLHRTRLQQQHQARQ